MATDRITFPRQYARTQRFTLGTPRSIRVAPGGSHLTFLRSASGTDRSHALWVCDLPSGHTRLAADPLQLLGGGVEELSAEERARRERSREGSAGIVDYATDTAVKLAAFALSGRLCVAELPTGDCRELATPGPVLDPRPSPDGRHVAYVAEGALRVVSARGDGDRAVATPEGPGVVWGLAEFIAAEEMDRVRGFWWSPESDRLLVTRVDDAAVPRWWISDPSDPGREPTQVAYPAAGTTNAEVTLHLRDLDGGAPIEVGWDRDRYPYLARVHWSAAGPPLLLVQSRDQRDQRYLTVDPATGHTQTVLAEQDPAWLELFSGVPAWAPDGQLVRIADQGDARVLMLGDQAVTDARLHVRAVLDVGERDVLFTASPGDGHGRFAEGCACDQPDDHARPGRISVFRASYGAPRDAAADPDFVTAPWRGVASAVRTGDILVTLESTLEGVGAACVVHRVAADGGLSRLTELASHAETPVLSARPILSHAGRSRIPTAVLLPTGYREGDGPLPVLMDPYGGPHAAQVVAAQQAFLTSQWFADQGFAVVVADGRGTPGHAPSWEKAVRGDLAGTTLDDQVEALHALAETHPLDLSRVGIRGWSYGGYLAALAVLRRPEVFHAGVAGAPVTDWRLYDTHYTERYLGLPADHPEVYTANSLLDDAGLSGAVSPHRPLLVIHGLADDNVVVAHSLRLSAALLAAGRPHEVLPLSGVTHMTPQEQITENLLLLQVAFLKRTLGVA